jgi:acetyl-CoA synthetase
MLKAVRSYEEACRTFRWRMPERYNLAFDVCDRQTMAGADGHRTALIVDDGDGGAERYTFHVLRLLANRLANVLSGHGVAAGDRVAVMLDPGVEAAVAVLAGLRMGAVVVPIPSALGAEPLAWRLADSGAKAIVAGPTAMAALELAQPALTTLAVVLDADGLWPALEEASDAFAPKVTEAGDPAFLVYPAHACGTPRGAVLAHRAMLCSLPAVEFALDFFPQFGDVMWTAADWMTPEALLWAVLPAWHHGVPVVAAPQPFDPGAALDLIGRHGVRVAHVPPGPLAQMAEAAQWRSHAMPRAVMTGPAPPAATLADQVARAFGVSANAVWGLPETGAVVADNGALMEMRPGSPGRAAPGSTVEAVDDRGRVLRAGERGVLAVAPGAPSGFIGWWRVDGDGRLGNGWLPTGHLGCRDLDGYLWPEPLAVPEGMALVDDKPVALAEVEAALGLHPEVERAAVVALPGSEFKAGELKAFVAARGPRGDVDFARELQAFTTRLRAAHEAPRRIEFVDAIPLAADGSADREALMNRPIRVDAPASDERWTPPRR